MGNVNFIIEKKFHIFHIFFTLQAKIALKEHTEAIKDFKSVLQIDPNNKSAKNQIVLTQQSIKQEKEKNKKLYGGMFDKFAAIDAKVSVVKQNVNSV